MSSPMLTSSEIDLLRTTVEDVTFLDTIIIHRAPTPTPNAFGDADAVFVVNGTIIGRLDPFPKQRDVLDLGVDRQADRVWHVLSVEWDADILEADRVVVNGQFHEIIRLFSKNTFRVSQRALVARLENE